MSSESYLCDSKKDHGINGGCQLHLLQVLFWDIVVEGKCGLQIKAPNFLLLVGIGYLWP